MTNNDDPEWEVVDSLPNEKKPRPPKPFKFRISKKFLIGAGIGIAIAIISPRFVVNLVRNDVAYWWLIVAIAAYWIIRRRVRR